MVTMTNSTNKKFERSLNLGGWTHANERESVVGKLFVGQKRNQLFSVLHFGLILCDRIYFQRGNLRQFKTVANWNFGSLLFWLWNSWGISPPCGLKTAKAEILLWTIWWTIVSIIQNHCGSVHEPLGVSLCLWVCFDVYMFANEPAVPQLYR